MSTIKVDTITTRTGSGNITISNDITGGVTLVGANTLTLRNDTSTDSNEPKLIFDNDTFAGANYANITTGNGGLLLKTESPSTSTFQNRHQILMNAGGGDDIQFNSSTNNGTSYTTQMKIEAGNVTIGNGNLVIGTSGKGIDFSATSNSSGSMSSELFDDYEEGTWTPAFVHQANDGTYNPSVTYDGQNGHYTKIGNMVYAHFFLGTDSVTHNNSGGSYGLGISGLPFTTTSNLARGSIIIGFRYSFGSNQPGQGSVLSNNTVINLWRLDDNGTNILTTDLGTGANQNRITGTVVYPVA